MTSARITSTSDVDLDILRALSLELDAELPLEVSDRQIFLKSAEPPSWILFLAEVPWWLKALGAYSALYVGELVKEAAKETWKARAKVIGGAGAATRGVLTAFAASLGRLRQKIVRRTDLFVGLPFPDDYFCSRLRIEGESAAEFEAQIALFVHHLPALLRLIESEGLSESTVAAVISLRLLDNSGLEVRWQDNTTHDVHTIVLPLDAA